MPVLKTSVENDIFWTELSSEFREPAAHPTKNLHPLLDEILLSSILNSHALILGKFDTTMR